MSTGRFTETLNYLAAMSSDMGEFRQDFGQFRSETGERFTKLER